jgi:nitrite reductase (NADH) small subunit/3-phenylpropionate/trans-cinnamate dioxygenase ferredoxin subunit
LGTNNIAKIWQGGQAVGYRPYSLHRRISKIDLVANRRLLRIGLPSGILFPSTTEIAMSEFVTVAKVGAIAEGTGTAFPVGDKLVAVFNLGGGVYQAINDLCPHMGASLADGPLEDGMVTCPWHAWRFRTSDGTWCDNPRI